MTKVLQTKCVGQAPHWSGHPLALNEYVYECEEPPKRKWSWKRELYTGLILAWLIFSGTFTVAYFGDRFIG